MYTICIKLNFTTFGRNKFGVADFIILSNTIELIFKM